MRRVMDDSSTASRLFLLPSLPLAISDSRRVPLSSFLNMGVADLRQQVSEQVQSLTTIVQLVLQSIMLFFHFISPYVQPSLTGPRARCRLDRSKRRVRGDSQVSPAVYIHVHQWRQDSCGRSRRLSLPLCVHTSGMCPRVQPLCSLY